MRSKEEAHDYRYFPDPDLLPLEFSQAYVDELAAHLPELPDAKKARLIAQYGLTPYDASILILEKESADFFEAVANPLEDRAATARARPIGSSTSCSAVSTRRARTSPPRR